MCALGVEPRCVSGRAPREEGGRDTQVEFTARSSFTFLSAALPALDGAEAALRSLPNGAGFEALRLRCLAATKVRDDALRAAAALSKRPERRRQLAEVLRRTVVLYEAGATRLHAPIDAEQAGFERVVCSPHARESRLVWRWVSLFEQRCAAQAASPPSAATRSSV